MTIKFQKGFFDSGKIYAWKNKQLYRMPFEKNKRSYTLQLLKLQKNSRGKDSYLINNKLKSIEQLKEMTINISFEVKTFSSKDTPF